MWWDNVDTSELHKNTKKVKENNTKRWRRFGFWRALKERVALRWAEWEGRERAFCPSFPSLLLPCLYVDKVERRRPVSAAKCEKHVCFLSLLVCYSRRLFRKQGKIVAKLLPTEVTVCYKPYCVYIFAKNKLSKQGCVTVVRSSATPPAKVFKAKQQKAKASKTIKKWTTLFLHRPSAV